jgi:hypothetical protein
MVTERRVRKSGKDRDGDITALCNDGQWWSPRSKTDAIRDIEGASYRYYVQEQTPRTYVQVVTVGGMKHLRTTADRTSKNNLDNLANC